MLHEFKSSLADATKCRFCKFPQTEHKCEVCEKESSVQLMYGSILMCPECSDKEIKLKEEMNRPENVAARVNEANERMNTLLQQSQKIDDSIQVTSDLFNANTVAIVELKKSIDSDESITNKPYALAEALTNRFSHLKQVIFERNEQNRTDGNEQKAIQVYLNNMANTLRAEEREKLKISDINYQPGAIKPVKPKLIKTSSAKKLDKTELKKYAAELGVAEFTLQMLVVSKGITVEQAANMLRKSIKEAQSESAPKEDNEPAVNMGTEAE